MTEGRHESGGVKTITLYPSDLTDDQWKMLEKMLPKPKSRGRPPSPMRRIINAILYVTRTGCQWRSLPHEYGAWQTVYGWMRRFKANHIWSMVHDRLRALVRESVGKRSQPTACILDSQTVRSADHRGEVGYDAAKKTKGRKRHLLVDTLGLILGVAVTPANVPEREGAMVLLKRVLGWFIWLRLLWADGGYTGPDFAANVRQIRPKLRVEVVPRLGQGPGFKVLRRRWVVERTLGWLMKQRRLVRDYEHTESSAKAFIYISMIRTMLRRLA